MRTRKSRGNARPSPSGPNPGENATWRNDRLRIIVGLLWVALLLAVIGYAAVTGEAGFAELDNVDFRFMPN